MSVKGHLHRHGLDIHLETKDKDKLIDHSCIATVNVTRPLSEEYADQILLCWNSRDALLTTIENALVSLAIIQMPVMRESIDDVAINNELLKIMGDSFKAAIAAAESET